MLRDATTRAAEAEELAISLNQRLDEARAEINSLQALRAENENLTRQLKSQEIELRKQSNIIAKQHAQEQRLQELGDAISGLQGVKSCYESKISSLQNEITDYRKAIRRLTIETGDELEVIDFRTVSPGPSPYAPPPTEHKKPHTKTPQTTPEKETDDDDWFSPLQI